MLSARLYGRTCLIESDFDDINIADVLVIKVVGLLIFQHFLKYHFKVTFISWIAPIQYCKGMMMEPNEYTSLMSSEDGFIDIDPGKLIKVFRILCIYVMSVACL